MTGRMFPIQTEGRPVPRRIPWSVAEKAYSVYVGRFGTSQTLQRLAERGGFGAGEMDMFYPDWLREGAEIERLLGTLREIARIVENPDDRALRRVRDVIDKVECREGGDNVG